MSDNSDELVVFNDDVQNSIKDNIKPWKLLIVDDENDIHSLTKMVLANYEFDNRPLEIHSAYSGSEAVEFIKENRDIAIILLDVVMETEDAGLKCVKVIREELRNQEVRIILRTGQPGQAPEHKIIINYDINDYKAKTELTSSKLFTVVTASLRSYKYIQTINKNRLGLEHIISASSFLFELQSFNLFARGILKQLTSILSLDDDSLYANSSSLSAFNCDETNKLKILAGTGNFTNFENEDIDTTLPKDIYNRLITALESQSSIFSENTYTGYFSTKRGEHTLLYFQWQRPLTKIDKDLITIFSENISVAFENISRTHDYTESQRNIIATLSKLIDEVSRDNSSHTRNVTYIACYLAEKLDITPEDVQLLKTATPLHDIGQISVPQSILKKPGKLTEEEFKIMTKHTVKGYEIFKDSKDSIIKMAKNIAYEHHERWDGSGYPRGISNREIDIFARIVGVADTYEALINDRCYRKAWESNKVIEYFKNNRGVLFDPNIVDVLLENIEYLNSSVIK